VVDWRGSIIAEGRELSRRWGIDLDWAAFADAWRGAYRPSMDRVARGESPWSKLDALHRRSLDELLPRFGLGALSEPDRAHLNLVWHRLQPWPDSVAGLARLRNRYTIATLSNGNMSLLADMAKKAALPWDCVLSAELMRAYKPNRLVYQTAAELLSLPTSRVMMVAAHVDDLRAARSAGMATGFVSRPLEWGDQPGHEQQTDPSFDVSATDFLDFAQKMGA
jgi:2-haloacid dehalogenase